MNTDSQEYKEKDLNLKKALDEWQNTADSAENDSRFISILQEFGGATIAELARQNWETAKSCEIMRRLCSNQGFKAIVRDKTKKLNVAICYRSIKGGGAQRSTAIRCNLLAECTGEDGAHLFNVILLTDDGIETEEYELSPLVYRDFLPNFRLNIGDKYKKRQVAWQRVIDKWKIDVVVYGLWDRPCCPWDMLSIKSHPLHPAFVLHSHSFFGYPFIKGDAIAALLPYEYVMADCVTVLSHCDEDYVKSFNPRTYYVPNPLGFMPIDLPESEKKEPLIVWVGRISPEKRPDHALQVLHYVKKYIPEVELMMIGTGDAKLRSDLQKKARELKVDSSVNWLGYQNDVSKYYAQGSVFICTSAFEGFCRTIAEAMGHALPVVSYDMPYLELFRTDDGLVTVEDGRYDLMAQEVIRLLNDSCLRRKIGLAGKQKIIEYSQFDIRKLGKEIIKDVATTGKEKKVLLTNNEVIFKYLTRFQEFGKGALRKENISKITVSDEKDSSKDKMNNGNQNIVKCKTLPTKDILMALAKLNINDKRMKVVWFLDSHFRNMSNILDNIGCYICTDSKKQGRLFYSRPVCSKEIIRQMTEKPFVLLCGSDKCGARKFLSELSYVEGVDYVFEEKIIERKEVKISRKDYEHTNKDNAIAFQFGHGFGIGDAVIKRSAFDTITEMAPNVPIDFFCADPIGKEAAYTFYADSPAFRSVYPLDLYQSMKKNYVLVFSESRRMNIVDMDEKALKKLSPVLFAAVCKLKEFNERYQRRWNSIVLRNYALSNILQVDQYALLGGCGALPISKRNKKLHLWPEAEISFKKMSLGVYCTVHVGSGGVENKPQIKEWAPHNMEGFIILVKNAFPNLKIVQIGTKNNARLTGVDRWIEPENLRVAEHILAHSLLHIDCEGGLVHIATQLGTKCAVVFGPTDMAYHGYKENINICANVCPPCYGARVDSYHCLRGNDTEPLCMACVTPEMVFEKTYDWIKGVLQNNYNM